jgi:hypothetical protein
VVDIRRSGTTAPTVIGDLTGRGIAGDAACLVIPFSPPTLLATVELVLARHAELNAGCGEASY